MERIRQLRRERGLSQAKLAVKAGMDPATLNRLERGKGNPNLQTLERVAKALDVEVADLFPKTQAPLPFEEDGPGQRRSSDVVAREDYEDVLEAWKAYMRGRARSWEQELGGLVGGHRPNDLPTIALWCVEVQKEAVALFAAVASMKPWQVRNPIPGPHGLSMEQLDAIREVDTAAERVLEAVWSAIDPPSDQNRGFGSLRGAAEEAASERGEFMRRLEERRRSA